MTPKIVWTWWSRGDNEDSLLGFHTKKDRDAFSRGDAGPFRRRVADDGRTVLQTATWADMIENLEGGEA